MKKSLIIAAIMIAAGMTQAASVFWSITNVRTPTPLDLTIDGTNAQFPIPQTAALVMNLFVVDKQGVTGNHLLVADAKITSAGAKASVELWKSADAITARDTYGSANIVTLLLQSVYTTVDGTYNLSFEITQNLGNIASVPVTFAMAMGNKTWEYTAVPEPTSMALLALGVAAVGLRRKFRK